MSQPPPPPRRRSPKIVVGPAAPDPIVVGSAPDTAGPNVERRRRRRWARPLFVGVVLAPVALIAGVVITIAGGSDEAPRTEAKPAPSVQLAAGTVTVESARATVAFPEDVRTQTMATLSAYVEAASVKPLRTGKQADTAALSDLFEPTAAAKLTGPDRATLLDEGFPKSNQGVRATAPPITLTALAGTDEKVVLASATFALDITAKGPKGTVHITRSGSMVFAPVEGVWKITGWRLSVNRDGPGLPVTPTTVGPAPVPTTRVGTATTKPSTATTRK